MLEFEGSIGRQSRGMSARNRKKSLTSEEPSHTVARRLAFVPFRRLIHRR